MRSRRDWVLVARRVTTGAEAAYRLAYDEAVRALAQQQASLDNLRTRAGIVLSAAAVATSLLGGEALAGGGLGSASWVGIAAFIALGGCVLRILLPQRDWEFTSIPRRIIGTYVEVDQPLSVPEMHRDLALHMEDSYENNGRRIDRLVWFFRVAAFLLTAEVVAWILDLAGAG